MKNIFIIIKSIIQTLNYKFNIFSLHIINLMLGFFIASVLSTIPAQTGDWGIISGAIIITINEILSRMTYKYNKNKKYILLYFINDIKIGIIYGLFVDSFKLGS